MDEDDDFDYSTSSSLVTFEFTDDYEEGAIYGSFDQLVDKPNQMIHVLPLHATWKDRIKYPFLSVKMYFKRLTTTFGMKFILFLFITQLLIKGILYRLIQSAALPIFKALGIDAASLQLMVTIASAPWTIKPLIGVASDLIPLGGYHKRYWLFQSVIVGILGGSLLILGYQSGAAVLVVCFLFINYEMSIADLMSEGKYSEMMRDNPDSGTDIITFTQGCQMAGTIIAMSFVGPMADEQMFHALFFIAMALTIAPIVPTLLGWLPEKQRSRYEPGMRGTSCCMFDLPTFKMEKGIFLVIAFSGLGGPILAIVTTYAHRWIGLAGAAVMIVIFIVGCYKTCPQLIANVVLYQVIAKISSPSIGSAMDYWYTADEMCVPGGPAFSFGYYITYTGILGAFVSFGTAWLYQILMSKWKFRTVLLVTLIVKCIGGLIDLIIVMRWNVAMGIPDKVFYIFGEAIVENVVEMLYYIPSTAIIGKVCPKRLESSVYAFVAGVSNFGGMISAMSGAVIFEWAGIKTISPDCDFSVLWILIIVCHIGAPLLFTTPATWLIPNAYQTDQLIEGEAEGTESVALDEFDDDGEESTDNEGLSGMIKKKICVPKENENKIDDETLRSLNSAWDIDDDEDN